MRYCAMETKFEAGQVLFREGEIANRFYLILEGKVALEAEAGESGPVEVQKIGAGEVLGWSWLFPPYSWHFAARALEPTKAIFFYGTWLREQCEQDKNLGYEVMNRVVGVVIERLQATRRELVRSLALPRGHGGAPGSELLAEKGEFSD